MFNAEQFCQDYRIESTTKGKHAKQGWIQIRCPFCTGNPGWHGGFNLTGGYYNCRRCGGHWMPKLVSKLLNIPYRSPTGDLNPVLFQTINKYSTGKTQKPRKHPTRDRRPTTITLPLDTTYVTNSHKLYLKNTRHFDNYQKIIRNYHLQSTGNIGVYQHRIFIPIYFQHQLVSYQCRATNLSQFPPYLACAEKDEIIPHKHLLYGFDAAVVKGQCVVVEGVTDVWRLGAGAVGTFGKEYTQKQLLLLVNNFDRLFRLFDADVNEDDRLEWELSSLGCETEIIHLHNGDPGSLDDNQAIGLMSSMGF